MKKLLLLSLFLIINIAIFANDDEDLTNQGKEFIDFSLKSYDGTIINSADLRDKPLIVKFGATWCRGCNAQTNYLLELKKHYDKNKFNIIEVFYRESADTVEAYVKRKGVDHYAVIDKKGKIFNQYEIFNVPRVFVVADKKIIFEGKLTPYEKLLEILKSLENKNSLKQLENFYTTNLKNRNFSNKKVLICFSSINNNEYNKNINKLKQLQSKNKDLIIININEDENINKIRTFSKDNQLNFPTLIDKTNRFFKKFNVNKLPKFILINNHKIIVSTYNLDDILNNLK